jgi:hypothetical protein
MLPNVIVRLSFFKRKDHIYRKILSNYVVMFHVLGFIFYFILSHMQYDKDYSYITLKIHIPQHLVI